VHCFAVRSSRSIRRFFVSQGEHSTGIAVLGLLDAACHHAKACVQHSTLCAWGWLTAAAPGAGSLSSSNCLLVWFGWAVLEWLVICNGRVV
jgi:hypothetical protein